MVNFTLASNTSINILKKPGSRTESWGAHLVTIHEPDLGPFTTTLWALPFSQFFTQNNRKLLIPQLHFYKIMLWDSESKELLESIKKTTATVFLLFTILKSINPIYNKAEIAFYIPNCITLHVHLLNFIALLLILLCCSWPLSSCPFIIFKHFSVQYFYVCLSENMSIYFYIFFKSVNENMK